MRSHVYSDRNTQRTIRRVERYLTLSATLATWEQAPADVQLAEHDYIAALRQRVRQERNYVRNRADPLADV